MSNLQLNIQVPGTSWRPAKIVWI